MNLVSVTSLFDLEMKAKTNSLYKQLAVITVAYVRNQYWPSLVGKRTSETDFQTALDYLRRKIGWDKTCAGVCERLNRMIEEVGPEPEPVAVAETPIETPEPEPKPVRKHRISNGDDYYTSFWSSNLYSYKQYRYSNDD